MQPLTPASPLIPNGVNAHHLGLHNLAIRERRPIIEFEYAVSNQDHIILTIYGPDRPSLLADLTDFLERSALHIIQANVYTLPNNAIMDQFTLQDPSATLRNPATLTHIHDTLIDIIHNTTPLSSRRPPIQPHSSSPSFSPPSSPPSYNYSLLGTQLQHPAPVAPPPGIGRRCSSNITLTALDDEQRQERISARRKSEALTADFVGDAISTLQSGEFLYYYSSSNTRYRHRFSLSEDRTHLCWGESRVVRLSRYAGCLFGPHSTVFQQLRDARLVEPSWLCFSLVANPPPPGRPPPSPSVVPPTIDLVCVSVEQLNRWFLALQSLCRPSPNASLNRLTLHDLNRLRVIFKIRALAHARGLTVRRFFLKRVAEFARRQSTWEDSYRQQMDEVRQLEAQLSRVQKTLIDYARRETLLNTSIRDFQSSWEVEFSNIQFLHPIGHGTFSEMWKAMWRSTPVAVKKLTTQSFNPPDAGDANQAVPSSPTASTLEMIEQEDTKLSPEDRRLLQDFRIEVTMLNKLRHPNVVLFLGAVTTAPNMCILTEFCHGGSLFAALRKRSWRANLSLQDLRHVARHIARGFSYLHAMRIIHRDLKSQNLLLDRPVEEGCPVIKVADFGLSRSFLGIGTVTGSVAGVMTSETGTYRWMAPEMIRHEPYNEKVDVYSFGVVVWELFSCEVPFAGMTPIQAAFAVADKHVRPKCMSEYAREVKIPAAWQALIERCWHRSSHERPRFQEVLKVLEEMETCAEGEIPHSLRKGSEPRKGSRSGEDRRSVDDFEERLKRIGEQSLDRSSDGRQEMAGMGTGIQRATVGETGLATGFGRSGSSPALSSLSEIQRPRWKV